MLTLTVVTIPVRSSINKFSGGQLIARSCSFVESAIPLQQLNSFFLCHHRIQSLHAIASVDCQHHTLIVQHHIVDHIAEDHNSELNMSFSASLPKAALDQLKGFITLCKAKPEVTTETTNYIFPIYPSLPFNWSSEQNHISSPYSGIDCVPRFCTTQSLRFSLTTSCPWEPASPPSQSPSSNRRSPLQQPLLRPRRRIWRWRAKRAMWSLTWRA